MMFRKLGIVISLLLVFSCTSDKVQLRTFQTENVIIVIIDGPRYSETWGNTGYTNIPVRDSLLQYGILLTNFHNDGATYTIPGHTAITTGNYQSIDNYGFETPIFPSIFQYYLKSTGNPSNQACIVASKDKLNVLSNCISTEYQNVYRPWFDCGVNGDGTGGYRPDSVTLVNAINVLNISQPRLMLIAFKDPDYYAHQGDSLGYINGIKNTDNYVGAIWTYIQSNPFYKDKTTLIVTNDHGRHFDGHVNGYVGHGDDCESCRHIEFFALSPDFKQNTLLSTAYSQIDISATIAEMLHFSIPYGKGRVMTELFK